MSAAVARRSPSLRLERDGELMRWVDRSRPDAAKRGEALDLPGLWRRVRRGPRVLRIFECPAPAMLLANGEAPRRRDDGADLSSELQTWATATSRGQVPPDWKAPAAEQVAEWLAPERLDVRAGAHVAKGALECTAARFRLRFPDVVRLPAALPEGRLAWLRELCLDTQSRWQLVRFAVSGDRVQAEVDLSGVPSALAQPLFARALEALVFSVEWALPALALVSDAGVESRTLDFGPWWLAEDLQAAAPEDPARSSTVADARAPTARTARAVRAQSIEE